MAKLLLAEVLKKKKLSKRRFARLINAEYYSVFRYFREGYDPKLSTLERWSKALGCRMRDLFKDVK